MKKYTVNAEGWLNGQYVMKDDVIEMTDQEAKYYLMEGRLTAEADKPKPGKPTKPTDVATKAADAE
jgi:hypothetical protein